MVKLVGINHVALEVGEAKRRTGQAGTAPTGIASDALATRRSNHLRGRSQPPDTDRHFGLVVDDKDALRAELEAAGVQVSHPPSLDFRDPWGNHVQAVDYRDVQFTKAPAILRGMGLELEKSDKAKAELRDKGLTSA
jgi:hypothetical protein